jgi:predicted phage terminase large subunit-like protein
MMDSEELEQFNRNLDNELQRRLARMHFWEYCLYMDEDFFTRRSFLKQVALIFQWVYTEYVAGRPRRAGVSMPPRAGKSYIVSLFCSWWIGKLPELSVMRNCCTARLYQKFSYDVRKIMRSEKYHQVFPEARLAKDKQNIDGWNVQQARQVSYFGAGTGGTIIGFGANIAISDDLYSGMEDALSENYNEKVHTWKESDHDSRKEKNCPELYIGTRWIKDDVIGRALDRGRIDRFVKIPAMYVDANGQLQSFCEDVKTTQEYLIMKQDTEESIWEAEWMQEPIEAKGLLFPKSSLKFFDRDNINWESTEYKALFVDPADKGGDDLSAPHCYLIEDRIYVNRVIYNKEGTDINQPEIIELLCSTLTNMCRIESNSAWILFKKNIAAAVADDYNDCDVRSIKSTTNKHTRILAMAAFIRNHFYFDKDYERDPQYKAFMKNLTAYLKEGSVKHDDAPDSLAMAAKYFQSTFPDLWKRLVETTPAEEEE